MGMKFGVGARAGIESGSLRGMAERKARARTGDSRFLASLGMTISFWKLSKKGKDKGKRGRAVRDSPLSTPPDKERPLGTPAAWRWNRQSRMGHPVDSRNHGKATATAERVRVVVLVDAGWGLAGFYFLEEPDEEDAGDAEQGEPAEDVDEGPVGRLLGQHLVEGALAA